MTRNAAMAALGMALLGGTAQAASEPQVWQGQVFIESVTGACTTAAVAAVGDFYTLVYRPIIAGVQSGPEGLTFVGSRSAQHWFTDTATTSFSTSATANVIALGSHANSSTSSTGGYSLIILPKAISTTTASVTITGLLSNFWNTAGCNVTISAALDRRID